MTGSGDRGFADYFSALAPRYAEYRPSYSPALAAWLAGVAPGRARVWDCGTGSGQAALVLAGEFEHVVATDPSPEQLAQATAHPRVEYRQGREAASGLPDAACDLVTAAQAAHWFDLPAFYAEATRVLRPDGVLAMWCYARTEVDPAVTRVIQWFEHERVDPYWAAARDLVESGYRTLPFPFIEIEPPALLMEARWDRAALLGYISTWSAVARGRSAEGRDPMLELLPKIEPLWPDAAEVRTVRWPIAMRVGRSPRNPNR